MSNASKSKQRKLFAYRCIFLTLVRSVPLFLVERSFAKQTPSCMIRLARIFSLVNSSREYGFQASSKCKYYSCVSALPGVVLIQLSSLSNISTEMIWLCDAWKRQNQYFLRARNGKKQRAKEQEDEKKRLEQIKYISKRSFTASNCV